MTRKYQSAVGFKQALEQRLRMASASGVDFARRRQLVVFDRFLARVAIEMAEAVTLKAAWRWSCASNGAEFQVNRMRERWAST